MSAFFNFSCLLIAIANDTNLWILLDVVLQIGHCLPLSPAFHFFTLSIDKYKVQSFYPWLFF